MIPRIQALLQAETEFNLRVGQRLHLRRMRMDKFRHGRVIFAGDSAHVSPFERGANSGVQDADNLAWKPSSCWRAGARHAARQLRCRAGVCRG